MFAPLFYLRAAALQYNNGNILVDRLLLVSIYPRLCFNAGAPAVRGGIRESQPSQ